MKNKIHAIIAVLFCLIGALAQAQTQTVTGRVLDLDSKAPLIGTNVFCVSDSSGLLGATTDDEGYFDIPEVPIGKQTFRFTFIGYKTQWVTIDVTTGKQAVLNIDLEEIPIEGQEVIVKAKKNEGEVNNDMITVSGQSFSVEQTNRYAGSRGDPARMASNFAGVQGADDSRNDIVVRGNSPLGILYKLEGIDLPNPNHFAVAGTSGGGVSILNNKMLANSDFLMSAFPAEYGNTVAGIFDLKLRNGNHNQHEFTGQFGFLGTEIMAEGPMSSKNRSSYLIMGRYSTLALFQAIGLKIGTDAVPLYGDMAYNFNIPLKKGGKIQIFGLGGASNIAIKISEQTKYSDELFGEGDRDQFFNTAMITSGMVITKPLNRKTYVKATLAGAYERQKSKHDFLIRSIDSDNNISVDSSYMLMQYRFQIAKAMGHVSINHKFNSNHILKGGVNIHGLYGKFVDSSLNAAHTSWNRRWDAEDWGAMVQAYVQWKYKINKKLTFNLGWHSQYYSISNSISYIEPRMGFRAQINNKHVLAIGAGLHSQVQPMYIYYYQQQLAPGEYSKLNKDMGLTKSFHSVLSYEWRPLKNLRFKTELYYQYLYNIPVEVNPSSFSMLNQGSGFSRFFPNELKNTGVGANYGIDISMEKFFDKSFYILVSGSLYDSKYKGSDGITRNTDFNGNYVANVLGGKDFVIKEKHTISLGLKFTYAGGKRYGFVDIDETEEMNELVFKDEGYNTRRFKDYYRLDFKIGYRLNAKKSTHEFGLDLVNLLNTKNILNLTYAPNLADPTAEPIATRYQLGFLPIFYYKIDFKSGSKTKEKE